VGIKLATFGLLVQCSTIAVLSLPGVDTLKHLSSVKTTSTKQWKRFLLLKTIFVENKKIEKVAYHATKLFFAQKH
jgi:hypothetical protein